jgi:hypothetical protein
MYRCWERISDFLYLSKGTVNMLKIEMDSNSLLHLVLRYGTVIQFSPICTFLIEYKISCNHVLCMNFNPWKTKSRVLHLTLSLLMELLVKPEILTPYIYMDLRLATLKAVSSYLLHNVSTLNQCRKLSCGTVVCKHFASYQSYPNYRWDLIL